MRPRELIGLELGVRDAMGTDWLLQPANLLVSRALSGDSSVN